MENDKWDSRKLMVTALIVICASILAGLGVISGDIWATVAAGVGAAYQIGNGMEHLSNR